LCGADPEEIDNLGAESRRVARHAEHGATDRSAWRARSKPSGIASAASSGVAAECSAWQTSAARDDPFIPAAFWHRRRTRLMMVNYREGTAFLRERIC
jgi:hypothetical protein